MNPTNMVEQKQLETKEYTRDSNCVRFKLISADRDQKSKSLWQGCWLSRGMRKSAGKLEMSYVLTWWYCTGVYVWKFCKLYT